MKPAANEIEIVSPRPGEVEPVGGKVRVKVRVKGDSPVIAVRAQAFRQHPPASPEFALTSGNMPHNYEGDIPVFPAGPFGIKAYAKFEGQPPVEVSVIEEPYEVAMLAGGGGEQVTIESPQPGPVGLGPTGEVTVRVVASSSGVEEVRAKAYSGGNVPSWDDMDGNSLNGIGGNRFEGTVFGTIANFRIRTLAKWVGGPDPPDTDDDKGPYSGS
jgi:hypothetical protein